MAATDAIEPTGPVDDEKVLETSVSDEMRDSFLEYALSVIVSRALPDVRDGLKPVHRRLLYSMYDSRYLPEGGYRKSAKTVGECFVEGALVSAPEGLVPIEEVKVGDRVLDGGGVEVEVDALFHNPPTELVEVSFSNGQTIRVTPGQEFHVLEDDFTLSWVKARDLYGRRVLGPRPAALRTVPTPTREAGEEAYALGLGVAEGSRGRREAQAVLAMADEAPLERVAAWARRAGHSFFMRLDERSARSDRLDVLFLTVDGSHSLADACRPKSNRKRVPSVVMGSRSRHLPFLAGLFDGDGHIDVASSEVQVVATCSRVLAEQVHAMLAYLGFTASLRHQEIQQREDAVRHPDGWSVNLAGEAARRWCEAVQDHVTVPAKVDGIKDLLARDVRLNPRRVENYPATALRTALRDAYQGGGWYREHGTGTTFRAERLTTGGSSKLQLFRRDHVSRSALINGGVLPLLRRIAPGLAVRVETAAEHDILTVVDVSPSAAEETFDVRVTSDLHDIVVDGVVAHQCLGNYHPHGDSSVYMALARMAQPWSLNIPVVDGHGNFGSLGGEDPPAAMRYTEAKLAKAAMAMVGELGEDTVDFADNYDGSTQEPEVMPAGFPFLLVNGSEGIAVGMRTNIPPHNLGEVIEACKLVAAAKLEGDLPDLDAIMEVLPGPDFPTGATIVGTEGVRELYATGAGRFSIRAKAKVEQIGPRSQGIIVTELPFSIGPEKIFDKMKQLIRDKKLDGISAADTKNLTDRRTGLKLQIGIKTGFNPAAVLERLYGSTHLEQTFSGQMVALVDGQPKQLTLVEVLDHYVDHRLDVVRRRTEYRKRKAEARLHIVDGLLTALGDIDTVVKIIRGSKNTDTARKNLIKKMDLTEVQASHILEMPLRRLTSMEVGKLKAEKAELEAQIAELEQLLGSPERMTAQVVEELDAVGEQFGGERRSKLVGADRVPRVDTSEVEIPDEPCVVTLSTSGLIGRGDEEFTNKHGRHDLILQRIATSTRATVYAFTNTGRVLPVAVAAIPELEGRSRGGAVTEFFHTERGERIVGISVLEAKGAGVALATADGMIKRILPTDVGVGTRGGVTPGVTVMGFREATDEVIGVVDVPGSENGDSDAELVLVTAQAQLLRFKADTVRPQGRSGGGVNGIKFKDDDEFAKVIALGVVPPDSVDQLDLVTRSDAGLLKVTAVGDYPTKGRYGQGVRCHKLLKDDTHLAGANVVAGVPGAMIEGTPEPLESFRARRDASGEDFGAAPEAVGSLR